MRHHGLISFCEIHKTTACDPRGHECKKKYNITRWSSKMISRNHNRSRFTLLELLIVIALIGILMTILIPSLIRNKDLAHAGVCLSNTKQITIGINQWVAQNNGGLPNYVHQGGVDDYWHVKVNGVMTGDTLNRDKIVENEYFYGCYKTKDQNVDDRGKFNIDYGVPSMMIDGENKSWKQNMGSTAEPKPRFLANFNNLETTLALIDSLFKHAPIEQKGRKDFEGNSQTKFLKATGRVHEAGMKHLYTEYLPLTHLDGSGKLQKYKELNEFKELFTFDYEGEN
jgi:prepilin-type N-terminal cleavage/methylation domain-containing protein